ncbi:MAG: hypothetical protein E1N59_3229 [Puniceicoccaceae bacterium 5H]|nr:MAG: hypothetical protein E1N59_3229 [Puniceicoccaceae bacterium 5H]
MGWSYLVLGLIGIVGLLEDRSWYVWLGVLLPVIIGLGELWLSRRLRDHPTPGRAQALCWHQLWILFLWAIAVGVLWHLDLRGVYDQLPPMLQRQLEEATAQFGMTGLGYLVLSWRFSLLLLTFLLGIKLAVMGWWHHRAAQELRRPLLPPAPPAST